MEDEYERRPGRAGLIKTTANRLTAGMMAVMVAGCAITPERFESNKYSLDDVDVCRALETSGKAGDLAFVRSVADEYARRNLDPQRCSTLIETQNRNRVAAVAAVLLVGAAVAAARSGGGGSPQPASYAPAGAVDYDWEWDQFYNSSYQLVWACRGVQTGQFAPEQRCAYKIKSDWKWPGPNFR